MSNWGLRQALKERKRVVELELAGAAISDEQRKDLEAEVVDLNKGIAESLRDEKHEVWLEETDDRDSDREPPEHDDEDEEDPCDD